MAGSCVTVKLKPDAYTSRTAQARLSQPSDDEEEIRALARKLLGQLWREGTPVRLIGVGVSDFSEGAPRQLDLFEDPAQARKRESMRALHRTTDALQERFGTDAVAFGRDIRLRQATTNTQPQHKEDD